MEPLRRIWAIMDYPCGKRLAPCMEWLVPKLEDCGELSVSPEVRAKLLSISADTIDRLLGREVTKRYDKAQTPYQRVLESDQVDAEVKDRLRETFNQLNPVELRRRIAALQDVLAKIRSKPGTPAT